MAVTTQKVAAFFMDLTMGKPDSVWVFKAGPKSAPTAFSVPNDLPTSEFYALFEEIATKIVQAKKADLAFISVMVDGTHIVRDPGFPLPSDGTEALTHLAAASKALNAARRSLKDK